MWSELQTPWVDFVIKGWTTMNLHDCHGETWPSEITALNPRRSVQFVISLSSLCHAWESRIVRPTCFRFTVWVMSLSAPFMCFLFLTLFHLREWAHDSGVVWLVRQVSMMEARQALCTSPTWKDLLPLHTGYHPLVFACKGFLCSKAQVAKGTLKTGVLFCEVYNV